MNCPTDIILNQLVDGELSAEVLPGVREHVQQCAVCARQVRAMQEMGNLVRGAGMPTVSDAVLNRLVTGARRLPDRAVRRVATWLTAAATVVLVVSASHVTSQSAQAEPALADWETVAIAPDASATVEQATARWIAADLSLRRVRGEDTP